MGDTLQYFGNQPAAYNMLTSETITAATTYNHDDSKWTGFSLDGATNINVCIHLDSGAAIPAFTLKAKIWERSIQIGSEISISVTEITGNLWRVENIWSSMSDDQKAVGRYITFEFTLGHTADYTLTAILKKKVEIDSVSVNNADNPIYTDTSEPTGFVDRTKSVISFDDGTLTFSISATGTDYVFYEAGVRYLSTGDTKTITDVEGIHVIYYDSGVLAESVNPSQLSMATLFRTKPLVSIVYWDATNKKRVRFNEERHGVQMDGATHVYEHYTEGMRYLQGLALNTLSVDGTGVTADAQFGIDAGLVTDEDILVTVSSIASTTGFPVLHMEGSENWRKTVISGFSARTYDGTNTTRLAYNEFTGGAWQLTEADNNDYVLYHIFASTDYETPMFSVMGQNTYLNLPDARNGALTELQSLILNQITFPEIRPIATVIYQTNLSYANSINAKIVSTDTGDDYIDWRNDVISRVEIPSPSQSVEKASYRIVSASATVITAAETYYPLSGVFADGNNVNFVLSASGTIKYTGTGGNFFLVGNSDLEVDKAGRITYALEKNTVTDTTTVTPHDFTSTSKIEAIGINRIVNLTSNDRLRVVVKSDQSGTTNLTARTLYISYWGEN